MNYLKGIYHYGLAWFGNVFHRFPSRKIFVIGVTGTKGKSTTLELLNAILEANGKKTALASSLRFKVNKGVKKNTSGMTMPGRFALQNFLRKAVNNGCQYALIEVTSQGILQHRHKFIDWDVVLFTNLQPEHLEAHGSFENYRQSKVSFFEYTAKHSGKKNKLFFVNEGDAAYQYFSNAVSDSGEVRHFSRETFVDKDLNHGKESIGDWLLGNFNLENAAAASAIAQSQGISWPSIRKALRSFTGVPGRMEYLQKDPFGVVIDYAHTPDSLEKVYQTLTNQKARAKSRKLICVLGSAGGGRDKWKRPVMGKIASQFCREIILTNEDPFDEKPEQIIKEIKAGISNSKMSHSNVYEIVDRKEAIKKAFSLAKKGDVIIITGKGSEDWIRVANGGRIPWNEKKVVEQILKK